MNTLIKISLVFAICILWIGTASAIDKTTKKSKSSTRKNVVVDNQNTGNQADSQFQLSNPDTGQDKKTHDDFIDANNNGIDDRAEKKTISGKTKKDQPDTQKSESKKKQ